MYIYMYVYIYVYIYMYYIYITNVSITWENNTWKKKVDLCLGFIIFTIMIYLGNLGK
jgi:hypothetical protein